MSRWNPRVHLEGDDQGILFLNLIIALDHPCYIRILCLPLWTYDIPIYSFINPHYNPSPWPKHFLTQNLVREWVHKWELNQDHSNTRGIQSVTGKEKLKVRQSKKSTTQEPQKKISLEWKKKKNLQVLKDQKKRR